MSKHRNYTVPIPEVPGKITFKTLGKETYVYYETGRIYDKEKQYTKVIRVCIGKVADKERKTMYPNDNYSEYFPEHEYENAPQYIPSRGGANKCGTYFLIKRIATSLGLTKYLTSYFGETNGSLILDIASFLIIEEDNVAQHYPSYAWEHPLFTPNMKIYSDAKISRLLSNDIKQDDIIEFTYWWNKGRDKRKRIYISYDVTGRYNQGDIDIVEVGHSGMYGDNTPIFHMSIGSEAETATPLFYEQYCGSVPDTRQLKEMVDKAYSFGYRHIGFILDRGFFSYENLKYLESKNYSFVIMCNGKKELVSGLILENIHTFESEPDCKVDGYGIYTKRVKAKLFQNDKTDRYFHLVYSPEKAASGRANLDCTLEKMSKELERRLNEEKEGVDWKKYTKYFDLIFSAGKKPVLISFSMKKDIVKREIELCGYFCIITSEEMEAIEAVRLYKSRDISEKIFSFSSTFLGSSSSRVHSLASVRAKTFIEFIALIIRCRLHYLIHTEIISSKTRANYKNVVAVIRELEKIQVLRIKRAWVRDTAITKRQREILCIFGISEKDIVSEIKKLCATLTTLEKEEQNNATDEDEEEEAF